MSVPSEQKLVKCPTCGKPVEWSEQQRWRPFCCERCKLIDLGEWLDEAKRIPGEAAPEPGRETDA